MRRSDHDSYLESRGIDAEMIVRNLPPPGAILEVAADAAVDTTVPGACDAGKVRPLPFGSTAQKILDHTSVPLIFGI